MKPARIKARDIKRCPCATGLEYGPHSMGLADFLVFERHPTQSPSAYPFRPCAAHAKWYDDWNIKRIVKEKK